MEEPQTLIAGTTSRAKPVTEESATMTERPLGQNHGRIRDRLAQKGGCGGWGGGGALELTEEPEIVIDDMGGGGG